MPDALDRDLSRRAVLRAGLLGGGAVLAGLAGCSSDDDSTSVTTTSQRPAEDDALARPGAAVLVVYFSRAGENYHYGGRRNLEVGNTEVLAGLIADRIECDTYRIEAADPYPEAYEPTVARNVEEERSDARPAIARPLPDVAGYDVVLLGSPIWNVQAPMIMSTFIEGVDLAGKVVLPYVTYAVSGMGSVEDDYRAALDDSDVRTGLAVRGETVASAGAEVDTWLRVSRLTA